MEMVRIKSGPNLLKQTLALRMIARADNLRDIILDQLYGLQRSGVNISDTQVQETAAKILRRAHLPTGQARREAEDRLRRSVQDKSFKVTERIP